MSDYWFNKAKENDLLRLEGPKGTFFLKNHTNKENLVFLATGTGIAPLKSIIESRFFEMLTANFKNIYLLWGMQYEKNIFWKSINSRIQFTAVLSREASKKYYIQEGLINLKIPVDKSVYYACGSDAMIQEVKKSLAQAGLDKQYFFSDSFLPSN